MTKEIIDTRTDVPEHSYGAGQSKQLDIKMARIGVIATGNDKVNITEPSTPTYSQYPYNNVTQSISGHIKEVDDTPGAERLFEMHKSGTFYEIHPDGTKVTKIFGDDFYIILKDHNLIVGGNLNITVQGDANFLVKGDANTKIDGNYNLTVNGNMTTRVKGNSLSYTKGTMDIQSKGNLSIKCSAKVDFKVAAGLNIESNSTLNIKSTGKTKIGALDRMDLVASPLHFNAGGVSVPSTIKLQDKDPGSGLVVSDSVTEPSCETLMRIRTNNNSLIELDEETKTFPKNRTVGD